MQEHRSPVFLLESCNTRMKNTGVEQKHGCCCVQAGRAAAAPDGQAAGHVAARRPRAADSGQPARALGEAAIPAILRAYF